MIVLRFLVDVNLGLGVADGLRDGGHDVVFAGDLDWCMPDADMLSLGRCLPCKAGAYYRDARSRTSVPHFMNQPHSRASSSAGWSTGRGPNR